MKDYHQILGIPKGASKDAIKRAFRKLAFMYHPDMNSAPGAHDKFIEISEAYEVLTSGEGGRRQGRTAQPPREEYVKSQTEAQERARAYARMRRKEFMKTDAYKLNRAERIIIEHLHIYFAWFTITGLPLITYLLWGFTGLAWAGGWVVVSWAFWTVIFTKKVALDFEEFKDAWPLIIKSTGFQTGVLFLFTIYTFLTSVLNSIVSHELMITLFIMWLVAQFINAMVRRLTGKERKEVRLTILAPMALICAFFFLNDVGSSNPTTETYRFVKGSSYQNWRDNRKSAFIALEGDGYSEAFYVRLFLDNEQLKYKHRIEYQFEDGLFGIQVMKGYELLADEDQFE